MMRLVIDMQGAQAVNRFRGIGRYTMSFSKAIARLRGEHEIILALNGLFPDTIEPIRATFDGLLPQENIRVWDAPGPVDYMSAPKWRRNIAKHIREYFLAHLEPDVVLVSSLFEGLADNSVTSIRMTSCNTPTAVILYDLIPYIQRKPYLENPVIEDWYLNKLDHFRRADLFLSISESSRQDGIRYLGIDERSVINISSAADGCFSPRRIPPSRERELRERYGLNCPFVMYTGGIDHRKNIEGLIRAYAGLPADILRQHQLAIVCAVQEYDRQRLIDLAKKKKLKKHDMILTGFVPDEDLIDLYNLCAVFVFPSWYEGFGLPALEAMSCGAPVIGANRSSLPEVIGRLDALFNPDDDQDITAKLSQALTDDDFRRMLARHGLEQARRFSWDESASRALSALMQWHQEREQRPVTVAAGGRTKLAYVSPLPPERSGISDYSAELLPELSRHYEIDVVVAQQEVSDSSIKALFPIRTIEWFRKHSRKYDRVLYHFGNSTFHQHMFDLLKEIPGVVILHDFFLSGIAAHMDFEGLTPGGWAAELYHSHGYEALRLRFDSKNPAEVIWRYPCNLRVLENAEGIIVHSVNSLRLAEQWYSGVDNGRWKVIPLLRAPAQQMNRGDARKALGLADQQFIACSFGMIGPTKLSHRLIRAWSASELATDDRCILVFVGANDPGEYGHELNAAIQSSGLTDRVRITGWADKKTFQHYLASADIGVQLRTRSRGETSAAVLDCMSYGVATIVNANGSMAYLDDDAVWKLPDDFTDWQLSEALETLWKERQLRKKIGARAREVVLEKHNPRGCAEQYHAAIERFSLSPANGIRAMVSAITDLECALDDCELACISDVIARNTSPPFKVRQLLVDISELVRRDIKSGIQRAVRSILREWLVSAPTEIRVEPVYALKNGNYRYARRFTLDFLNCPQVALEDDPVDFRPGDIFLGLDLQPQVVDAHRAWYQRLRGYGVRVYFVVYDLLCVLMPQHFIEGATEGHTRWLEVVAESDGAFCISKAVADELGAWVERNGSKRLRPFQIDWFHLGADVENSVPTKGVPGDAGQTLDALRARISFLMVGTIEPRKGHAQALAAFDRLWGEGQDLNLVIVGKQGWMVERLINRLRAHSELNTRLFWLDGISDEYLDKVYAASTCLIAASEGEGFGLPLIEAAQHELPIIARDTPVFREVAGERAFYFNGDDPEALANTIEEWLALHDKNNHPKSGDMPWLTWKESAATLLQRLLGEDYRLNERCLSARRLWEDSQSDLKSAGQAA